MPVQSLVFLTFLLCLDALALQQGLLAVWGALGWKQITLVVPESSRSSTLTKLFASASKSDVTLSVVDKAGIPEVLMLETNATFVANYLVFLSVKSLETEIRQSLLLFRRPYTVMVVSDTGEPGVARDLFRTFDFPSGFFYLTLDESFSLLRLTRIQTFLRGESYVEDSWKQSGDGTHYKTSYNMQGHLLATVALTWEPWLEVDEEGCPPPQTDCPGTGVLPDILDALGKTYNFSWSVAVQQDRNWGVNPQNTEDGLQAEDYVGVLGDVVNRRYDICLSVWRLIHERTLFADYTTPVANLPRILMIDGGNTLMDLTLFLRPFTSRSWFAIVAFVVAACAALALVPRLYHLLMDQVSLSGRIVTISAWMFFLVLNAYYGGALTMFFSSPPSQPFSDLRDGLSKYPTWDLVMQSSTEAHIVNRAKDRDPPYAAWLKRQEEKGGRLFPTMKETLTKLTTGRFFTDVELAQVAAYLNGNPISDLKPTQVGSKWKVPAMLITSKNSPITIMLNEGLQRLRQSGTFTLMMERYLQRLPGEEAGGGGMSLETMVLGGGHLASVFFCGIFFLALTLLICMVEVIWHRTADKIASVRREK